MPITIKTIFNSKQLMQAIEAKIVDQAKHELEKEINTQSNMLLTRNEIIALKHLSDGMCHDESSAMLTDAQYYAAIKSLQSKEMVRANFVSGEKICSTEIIAKGKAALDDLKQIEKHVVRNIIKQYDISQDQLELLKHAKRNGKCEDIFNVGWHYYDQTVKELCKFSYVDIAPDSADYILTRSGIQLLEEIENELYSRLAGEYYDSDMPHKDNAVEQPPKHKVKDGALRISEGHVADVIKVIWSMWDTGLFVDENGEKPTIKNVMDSFGEFMQAEQFKNYSSYMNKAEQASQNTFLDVFYKLESSAEKHYNNKKSRAINK